MSDEEPRNSWDWEQPEAGLIRGDVPTAPIEDIGTGEAGEATVRTGPGTPLPPPDAGGGVDRRKAVWMVALLALVALVVVGVVALTGGGDDGDRLVAVPDLTGLDQASVEAELSEVGLTLGEVTSAPGTEGEVVSQTPVRGADADEGAAIDIVVGDGSDGGPTPTPTPTPVSDPDPELVAVPSVMGLPASEAEAELVAAGLEVEVRQVADAAVPEGDAIGTSPGDGSEMEVGDSIVLLISSGPAMLGVPDVTGRNPLDASAELINLGFDVNTSTCVIDEPDERGAVVVEQTPVGGGEAELGSSVRLCVGATPTPTVTPTPSPTPTSPPRVINTPPPRVDTPTPDEGCRITDDNC